MSSASPPTVPGRQSGGDAKKTQPPSSIVTRNGARKAKIQTRARTAATSKPSASVVAAKRKAQLKKKTTVETVLRDHYQITMDAKTKVKGPTGFVTEPRMVEHKCLWDENYPENPLRLISVINRCHELNLIEQCTEISPRAASKEEILNLHDVSVYSMMEKTHRNNDVEYLEDISSCYDAVYIHPSTHELALIAAGSTINLVDHLIKGDIQNGAAFVRPPGHHAMKAEPCGYCIYNNVALAAKHALQHGLSRILIVDWDVHHGQATQQMFYNDPRVVYFSIHRYEHGSFWPNLRQSNFDYIGEGKGEGFNFNVPLNQIGMKDADYLAIWYQLLLPMAFEYQPELILISAGYDAAIGCPEGEMLITPACYATLTHLLMGVCSRIGVVLEGGYCPTSLAEGAALTLRTLLGHPPPMGEALTEPTDSIQESILNCIYAHKNHWKCFYQPTYSMYSDVKNVCDVDKDKHTVIVKWEGDETRPDKYPTRNCYPLQSIETKRNIADRLRQLQLATDLTLPEYPVCYIYDEAMLKHKNICEPGHVECPQRIMRVHERHMDFGLIDRVHLLTARCATDEDILAVHSEKHLTRLKDLSSMKLRELHNTKDTYDSVYFHPDSLESATTAAGCVLQMVDSVLSGQAGSGVCVVRPPGHHADKSTPCGFCLINNVAIAAQYALKRVKRVLILDWDVHHGNGTQSITLDNEQILYVSLHRYDNGTFFPQSRDADHTVVGTGKGEGFNVNIPWNKRGMGDAEYIAAFTQVVMPIAREYHPDLVLVSAGFDACFGDPIGGCKVSPECYGVMTHMLRSLAGGRVILCLEGGYNITSISYAMAMCTKALLGDPIYTHYDPNASCNYSAIESINDVIKVHKKYWKNLKFQLALPIENVLDNVSPKSTLEDGLANLTIGCTDGIHCGTDDEGEGTSKNTDSGSKDQSPETDSSKPKTLVDFLSDNMQAIVDGEMFAVVPLPGCPHLDSLYAIPSDVKFQQGVKCTDCDHTIENWVCLHCYITACGRHINGHMAAHYSTTHHPLSLSLADLSVWCYPCDAYVDNPLLFDAKNNAHKCKFGEEMPWCYKDGIHMA
ncbi:histone deacetylase 6 isoform X1 [Pieris napi]|uniref:histone deacetylase 6 isoform X1 n=1 Tax=Pieris napi TaxID=78633 RepID=UPI001FBA5F0F|nr:histone deacetylase 6 isoform X1 [Pieris napi]